ncbi:hypothetical protein TMatcc_001941 [Talaromyces marneffei ATCC 18224]|uniref:GPI anchored cell wall protein n=2 Tax=Talaromyces marneffei TaxID=37727 RepID=B6QI85_TALMQ|nr:uncharacterized protein EYB26_006872 [Talaromyces marneffei]EEA23080.1 conserved hypothetical protein [Talaromyces marneffei ATCC 18224]KAE8551943.1 hypothetical protein EYB25_005834 [Talaromyces marneffei]QGA19184.1 hypothetical protein EYB26_006872 [Talaromyces marneffei]
MRTSFAATALSMAALAAAQGGLISNLASSGVTTASPTTFASGTTTIKMFEAGETNPGMTDYYGSIISADAVATTVLVNCRNPSDKNCVGGVTMVGGPSTWHLAVTTIQPAYGVDLTIAVIDDCKITASTQAICGNTIEGTASAGGQKTTTASSSTRTYASSEIYYDDLLITAGVEKLTSPQATQTPKGAGAVAAPVPTGNFGLTVGGMAAAAVVAAAGLL